jgi:hypothetical protein
MSDELDPELSRVFAEANRPLPNAEFHARVIGRLQPRPHGWFGVAQAVTSSSRAALAGLAMGIVAPFRLRAGYIGLMTASAAVMAIWAMLQGA